MRTCESADVKNQFGELEDAASTAPVAVTKFEKLFVVVVLVDEYERLQAADMLKELAKL